MNFREYINESLTKLSTYKNVDSNMKADNIITDDKYYDKIYVLNKDTYEKAEKQMVMLVARTYVWKVDYDPKKYTISVRFEK